MNKFKMEDGLL